MKQQQPQRQRQQSTQHLIGGNNGNKTKASAMETNAKTIKRPPFGAIKTVVLQRYLFRIPFIRKSIVHFEADLCCPIFYYFVDLITLAYFIHCAPTIIPNNNLNDKRMTVERNNKSASRKYG